MLKFEYADGVRPIRKATIEQRDNEDSITVSVGGCYERSIAIRQRSGSVLIDPMNVDELIVALQAVRTRGIAE